MLSAYAAGVLLVLFVAVVFWNDRARRKSLTEAERRDEDEEIKKLTREW